jgi:heme/copper-type cytochrome/quinol oxidase subunit 3
MMEWIMGEASVLAGLGGLLLAMAVGGVMQGHRHCAQGRELTALLWLGLGVIDCCWFLQIQLLEMELSTLNELTAAGIGLFFVISFHGAHVIISVITVTTTGYIVYNQGQGSAWTGLPMNMCIKVTRLTHYVWLLVVTVLYLGISLPIT